MKNHRWLGVVLLLTSWCRASEITFTVSMARPETHYVQVRMECRGFEEPTLDFKMPAWTPGYYKIMDHARHVLNLRASNGRGQDLPVQKTTKNTWRVTTAGASALILDYEVYAYARSVADSFLDDTHAFLSPTGVFLYVDGQLQHPVTVRLEPHADFQRVSTGLDPVADQVNTFAAPDSDVLFDCPWLVGNQDVVSFTACGLPHTVAVHGTESFDRQRLVDLLTRMIEAATAVVGKIPYRHYSFLFLGAGRGGLEHANSMAVYTTIPDLNEPGDYLGWLSFITHEYFHLYNVKAIRPRALGPFDYDRENYTPLLWLSEGGTVYYQYLILNRAGLMSRRRCLEELGDCIAHYERIPGSRYQSAAAASFDVWLYFLNSSGDAANTTISYYDKGAALCMLLDVTIRQRTNGAKSLDDVMRQLYRVYFQEQQRGFTEAEFRRVCEETAGGLLTTFFERYVAGTDAIDYAGILAGVGVEISLAPEARPGGAWGAHTRERDGKVVMARIEPDSAAARAGFSVDGELIAWDGDRLSPGAIDEKLETATPGQPVRLLIARHGQIKEIELIPDPHTEISYEMGVSEFLSSAQRNLLDHWLIAAPDGH